MTDLEILRADLAAAHVPLRRGRIATVAIAVAVTTAAMALAANHYLGEPAPAHVRATFARLAAWQPWVKINTAKAEVVALSRHTVLYGAPAGAEGYCLELLGSKGFEYELICSGPRDQKSLVLYAGIANHGTAADLPPVAVTGRTSERGHVLEARTPDGHVQHVLVGLHGFFSFEPAEQAVARRGELVLYELDARGNVTARKRVPAQIVLDARGTPARKVDGVIFDPRARHISFEIWAAQSASSRVVMQTGIQRSIEVGPHGRFSFTAPHVPYRTWWLTMLVTDARFIPLDPGAVDGTRVPDERYWQQARAEAARG